MWIPPTHSAWEATPLTSPLFWFCRRREVDLDGKNIGGWTPLMYAAYIGHDNIVNLLLEAGVNVNAATAKGLTPLMLAASCGNESIAYFLLQVQHLV